MAAHDHTQGRLNATNWIIDARWYYAPLVFFLGIVIIENAEHARTVDGLLVGLLGFALVSNLALFLVVRRLSARSNSSFPLAVLNATQIGVDLFCFFVIMLVSGGLQSVVYVFFFVPIVVSVILFGFRGALVVASLSGFAVFSAVFIQSGIWGLPTIAPFLIPAYEPIALLLTKSGVITLVFVLVGFFGGYITRIITARDVLLVEQVDREAIQIEKLEKLNRAFDDSAKLLVRRDLELYNANQKLMRLDQMKSEIISVVAHQLRTPLSATKWMFQMLLDGDIGTLPPEQKSFIMKGHESNERMIALINDLLSVDRLESGKFKYVFVPVQLEELVRDMVNELLPIAAQRRVRIDFDLPAPSLPKIKVDPDKIRDVLQNIIDNAIKYSKDAGVVRVALADEGSFLHLSVSDSGIGIPESEKDKIFARFFRASNAVRADTNGSGLGLFIAYSIVRRHGGELWFDSKEGEGTTFHATLPKTA